LKYRKLVLAALFSSAISASSSASEQNLFFDWSTATDGQYLQLADRDDRQDRRQERGRSDERHDRRDCRRDEGLVGEDKRECKQEEVRDGVRGNQGERFDDDDDDEDKD
jgi:hypothetical protein